MSKEVLVLYVAGELPAPEAAQVEAHLARCEACRAEAAALGRGLRALAWLGEAPAMRPVARARLEAMAAEPASRRRTGRRAAWAAIAAAVVLASGLVLFVRGPSEDVQAPDQAARIGAELDEIEIAVELLESGDRLAAYDADAHPAPDAAGSSRTGEELDEIDLWFDMMSEGGGQG